MSVQPIRPVGDERVQHKTAVLNGYTYHYLYAEPTSGKWSETVFLVCWHLITSLLWTEYKYPCMASRILGLTYWLSCHGISYRCLVYGGCSS